MTRLPLAMSVLALGCTGYVLDPLGDEGGGPGGRDPSDPVEPAKPGLEFECTDGAAIDPGPSFVRRLTLHEYVATVRAAVGVDVRDDADRLLPRDLRADGFSNTSAALIVTLSHVEAYEELARIAVSRIPDVPAFLATYASCTEVSHVCAGEVIDAVGQRLYRAPLETVEREALLGLVDAVQAEGEDFDVLGGLLLEAMLQSPRFLYRIEEERGDGSIRALDSWEVASRLSYLLWNAPPDDALFEAAATGALGTDAEVEVQIRRMLDDPRTTEASLRYLSDWVNLGRLDALPRDPERYPAWTTEIGHAMQAETRAFFEHVVWEERRPVLDLFDTQVAFLTPELAVYYELPAPEGTGMAAVDVSAVPERGGLLTQGALLTVGGDKSSMVARGLFLLESILCGHLDSPPPGIDTTPPEIVPGSSQRTYSEDRVNSDVCGGCHAQMEPLAWGIERFDGTGRHRLEDEFGNPLLSDGFVLEPGRTEPIAYETIPELMEILSENERVRDCITLKVTQFALGRPLVSTDTCGLAAARDDFAASEGTYQDLLISIGRSEMFRTLRTGE